MKVTAEIVQRARELYNESVPVGPKWEQLGDVTKGVWIERAMKERA